MKQLRFSRTQKSGIAFSDYLITQGPSIKKRSPIDSFSLFLDMMPLTILILIFFILFVRLFYLNVIRASYYKDLSDGNRIKRKIIPSPRGIIFDKQNRALVRNVPAYKIVKGKKVEWIDKEKALSLMTKEDSQNVVIDTQREYLYKDVFPHVLGFIGQMSEEESISMRFKDYEISEFVGKSGLEYSYERQLHGENGEELFESDALGKITQKLGVRPPYPGTDLYTTLDLDIQRIVVDAMRNVHKGAAIVTNVEDGGVIALFSKPTFDPNIFTHGKNYKSAGIYANPEQAVADTYNQPFLDRAISGLYPPGSTYKLITAVAALASGKIDENTKIEDTGVLQIGKFSFGNWYYSQYGRKEGLLSMVSAIKRSNDIYFYKAAEAAGVDRIAAFSHEFGLGEKLGIDIPGEAKGVVPSISWKEKEIGEQWYLGDTYNLGIGQGYLLVTPLQVNSWTSVFATNGILYRPHIAQHKEKILRKDFIKKEHIEVVRTGMKEACENGGTAYPFFDFKVKNPHLIIDNLDFTKSASDGAILTRIAVGCKTGTAETSTDQKPHAWFTIFAPFYKPEVVVTVFAEYAGEGSQVAVPIAKQILEKYFESK